MADKLISALQGVPEKDYGPSYRDHTLQIYKVYLELTDRISERREKANSFFLTVNTALIALLAKGILGSREGQPQPLELLVPLAGCVLCYLWYRTIRSYKDLNSARYRVIHAMEDHLPLRPYDAEWESVERGKNPQLYLPLTHVERNVPWLFMVFHALIAAAALPWSKIGATLLGFTS